MCSTASGTFIVFIIILIERSICIEMKIRKLHTKNIIYLLFAFCLAACLKRAERGREVLTLRI